MIDLLLINPGGRERIYQGLGNDLTAIEPPLWCRLIAGYCRDRGWTVRILDAEAEGLTPEEVAKRVAEQSPCLVALVVYGHQPSASTQQMTPTREIAKEIRGLAPVIMVGGHIAALPERTLREEPVDFACNSEGPETIDGLLHRLPVGEIEGLVYRDGPHIRSNTPPPLIDPSELHGKAWDLLPMDRYRAHNWQCFDGSPRQPYASIYTSLGCPYKCVFCCINAPFGTNRYRMREPAEVVAEIDHLVQTYNVRTFKIVDEMFVLNQKHVKAICEGLAAKPYASDLNIWAYARIDTVKDGQPEMLRKAGIRWLALGIESGSAHVRDGAEKSLDDFDIRQVVKKIQAAGISVLGNFIYGLRDDDLASMTATLDLAKQLNCEFVNFYSAMAYPGSRLFAEANPEDLPDSWAGYSQHALDTKPLPTETLSSEQVLAFRDMAFTEYFTNHGYLAMIEAKFGAKVRDEVVLMAVKPLPRKAA